MLNPQNKQKILNSLMNKNFVKIISGIKNYDKQKSLNVAMAAELGGATALDICDDPEIIKPLRALVQLPIFVSSIDPLKLIASQSYGIDALEIGNYESFYKEGKMFTPSEILDIARFVKKSVTLDVILCCTIPATLETENQVKLARELIILGYDIIQTEGFAPEIPASDRTDIAHKDIRKAASTLANTTSIRKALPNVSIITASGVTPATAPLAIAMGASGVGIGTYISTLSNQPEMTDGVKEIMARINSFAPKYLVSEQSFALKH